MKDPKTVDDINQEFQDYQDDLTLREKRLRLPSTFDTSSMDDLISMLDLPPEKQLRQKR